MVDKLKLYWKKNKKIISYIVALIGLGFYLIRSWEYINTIASIILDESLYIYKGYLFASGKYVPYQDYGPWTNHLPMSFLIPGYVQVLFGPGIRTARYFVFFLGTTSMIALWLVAKRLGGHWWAAMAIWAISLNTMWVESFSFWTAQILVNSFILWIFVFSLGEKRTTLELVLGGVLAGILGMTRLNLLPFIGLYILYIFWQNGWKKGLFFVLAFSGIFITLNIIYWPNILKFWASWLPINLTPFLNDFRFNLAGSNNRLDWVNPFFPISAWLNDPSHTAWSQIQALFRAFRWSLLPFLSVLVTIALMPKRKNWKSETQYKISMLLIVTYLTSIGIHMAASLSGKSCSFYCIEYYMLFFNVLGLLVIISAFSSFSNKPSFWKSVLVVATIVLVFAGINYEYSTENKGKNFLTNLVLDFQIPRIEAGKLKGGFAPVSVVLEAKTDFEYNDYFINDSILANIFSFIVVVFLVFIVTYLLYLVLKSRHVIKGNFIQLFLILLLCLGFIYSPAEVFGGGRNTFRCEDSILDSYEIAGEKLAKVLPNGAKVYIEMYTSLILLYVEDIQIYTPQINASFSKIIVEGEFGNDELYASGRWNQSLADQWLSESDYVLVQGSYFNEEWVQTIENGEFELVLVTNSTEICRGTDSEYWLLKRIDF